MIRIISWFSCGAASAVATDMAIKHSPIGCEVVPVYCDTSKSEHPDNLRFFNDVQRWIGRKILKISNPKYETVDDVFEKEKFMSSPYGARCTLEAKKAPRQQFSTLEDVHVFGFTSDEGDRIKEFKTRNPEMKLWWPLQDLDISKTRCYQIISDAGIRLPEMYLMGYRNNNCLGCVKSSSPGYWNKIRHDFPDVFERRCRQSRELGVRLVEITSHNRIFLDELPDKYFKYEGENLSCGPECGQLIPPITRPPI